MSEQYDTQHKPTIIQPEIPKEGEPGYESMSRTHDPNERHGLFATTRRKVAAGIAAGAILLGAGAGAEAMFSGKDVEAKPPVATAPANPGETTPSTQSPAPSETGDTRTSDLNLNTFPFVEGDKVYTGETAFQRANQLAVDKYTEENFSTGILNDGMDVLNSWISSGATKPSIEAYGDYASPAGKGIKAVGADFYDKAYAETITSDDDLTTMMNTSHQTYLDLYEATQNSPTPYEGKYVVKAIDSFIPSTDGIVYYVELAYTDNQANTTGKNTVAKMIQFSKTTGADGRQVFKISKFGDSPYAK